MVLIIPLRNILFSFNDTDSFINLSIILNFSRNVCMDIDSLTILTNTLNLSLNACTETDSLISLVNTLNLTFPNSTDTVLFITLINTLNGIITVEMFRVSDNTFNITTINDYGINYKILKLHNPWLREDHLNNSSGKKYYIEIPEKGAYTYTVGQ